MTLAQVVVAGFYGDTAQLTDRWWGGNFFPRGFPYFLSLYLGLATLVTAAVGAVQDRGPRRRLAAIAIVALLLALGRWGLGAAVVEAFDLARRFRYPSKLFFAVHLAVALLVGLGADALANGARSAWRRLALAALAVGVLAASAPAVAMAGAGARALVRGRLLPARAPVARAPRPAGLGAARRRHRRRGRPRRGSASPCSPGAAVWRPAPPPSASWPCWPRTCCARARG